MIKSVFPLIFLVIILTGCFENNSIDEGMLELQHQLEQKSEEVSLLQQEILIFEEI